MIAHKAIITDTVTVKSILGIVEIPRLIILGCSNSLYRNYNEIDGRSKDIPKREGGETE